MNETKHTPGPWKIQEAFNRIETDREIIATVDGWELGNGKANARLIAAAPELLQALEQSYTELQCEHGGGQAPTCSCSFCRKILAILEKHR